MTQIKHKVHVVPWLRRPGRLLLKEWLAITIGRDIFVGETSTRRAEA